VIVAPTNPISKISRADLARVFSGEIVNWAQLGGPSATINVYAREETSGASQVFRTLVMDQFGRSASPRVERFATDDELSDAVARDPNGLGVVSFTGQRSARAVPLAEACGIVVAPSAFNVKAEEYPLSRRLLLYTTGRPLPPQARNLLDYSLSELAQDVIADLGYVDQSISELDINLQGRRVAHAFTSGFNQGFANLTRDLLFQVLDGRRLSTTFRFRTGSATLDNKALQDVERLLEYLSLNTTWNEVLLIGFTDEVGAFENNRRLSEARAEQVRQALLSSASPSALDGITLRALGYGELSPVACNDSDAGRQANRRVEVWVRFNNQI
jgi:phosphate transport system substrate-binding protein